MTHIETAYSHVLAIPATLQEDTNAIIRINKAPYQVVYSYLPKYTINKDLLVQLPFRNRYLARNIGSTLVIFYHIPLSPRCVFYQPNELPQWPPDLPMNVIQKIHTNFFQNARRIALDGHMRPDITSIGFPNTGNSCFINAAVNLVSGIFVNPHVEPAEHIGTDLQRAMFAMVNSSFLFHFLGFKNFHLTGPLPFSRGRSLGECTSIIRAALPQNNAIDQGDASEVVQLLLDKMCLHFPDNFENFTFSTTQEIYDSGESLKFLACRIDGKEQIIVSPLVNAFERLWELLPRLSRTVSMLGLVVVKNNNNRDFYAACLRNVSGIPEALKDYCHPNAICVTRLCKVQDEINPKFLTHKKVSERTTDNQNVLFLHPSACNAKDSCCISSLIDSSLKPESIGLLPIDDPQKVLFNSLMTRRQKLTTSNYLFVALPRNDPISKQKITKNILPDAELVIGVEPSKKYVLYGIVCHLGSAASQGHYLSVMRAGFTTEWLVLDDNRAYTVSENAFRLQYAPHVFLALYKIIN